MPYLKLTTSTGTTYHELEERDCPYKEDLVGILLELNATKGVSAELVENNPTIN